MLGKGVHETTGMCVYFRNNQNWSEFFKTEINWTEQHCYNDCRRFLMIFFFSPELHKAILWLIVIYNLSLCLMKSVRRGVEKECEQHREKHLSYLIKKVEILRVECSWNYNSNSSSVLCWKKNLLDSFARNYFRSPFSLAKFSVSVCSLFWKREICYFQQSFKVN
jgi:hypothetical protein